MNIRLAAVLFFLMWGMAFKLPGQNVYVDGSNSSGTEDGTRQYPFNTVEEGIAGSKTGDTIFIKSGTYKPQGGEIILRPGIILFGENPANTIINGNILDTTPDELPFEIHNLTFADFICKRVKNETAFYFQPCIIKNNVCDNIIIGHAGGYTGDLPEADLKPVPFFHIMSNTVSGEITFTHGAGMLIGRNIVKNNSAENISLKHGTVTAPLSQPAPGYGYLFENNTVNDEISFAQGACVDSARVGMIRNLARIVVNNNKADYIGIRCQSGYTFLIDNNTLQKGIEDRSGACWTTISNNTVINGRIVDKSAGMTDWECETPDCMIEDQFIENNIIFFEATGDPDEDFALIARSHSVTIRGNTITCKGPASGILLASGAPAIVTDNIIYVDPAADFGIKNTAGYGVVAGNQVTGGKTGYYSRSGTVLFENNVITGSHWGFYGDGGNEEVKSNSITGCTGHGMVLNGLRGPVSGNTVTGNDSTGILVLRKTDLEGVFKTDQGGISYAKTVIMI